MPLIVISGLPSSGKSSVVAALADACRAAGQEVQVVDEDSLHLTRNDSYKGRERLGDWQCMFPCAAAAAACRRRSTCRAPRPPPRLADAASEKVARGAMLSAIDRCLGRRRTVIFDTQNAIKGYRYQLWCIARQARAAACLHGPSPLACCPPAWPLPSGGRDGERGRRSGALGQ